MQNAELLKVREECCHERLSVCNYPDLILTIIEQKTNHNRKYPDKS